MCVVCMGMDGLDGCPIGLGLVVEDKPTEFSCVCSKRNRELLKTEIAQLSCKTGNVESITVWVYVVCVWTRV